MSGESDALQSLAKFSYLSHSSIELEIKKEEFESSSRSLTDSFRDNRFSCLPENQVSRREESENDRPSVVIDRKLPGKYRVQHVRDKLGIRDGALVNIKECRKKYQSYKSGAQKRQVGFSLTFTDSIRLFTAKCHYCGLEARYNGSTRLSGIDRKDSDRSYTLDNVVPCCTHCNMAKGVMTLEDFESMALHIALQIIRRHSNVGNLESKLTSFIHPVHSIREEWTMEKKEEVEEEVEMADRDLSNSSETSPDFPEFTNSCDEYILGLC